MTVAVLGDKVVTTAGVATGGLQSRIAASTILGCDEDARMRNIARRRVGALILKACPGINLCWCCVT